MASYTISETLNPCPLCKSTACVAIDATPEREFILCSNCALVFVPGLFHISASDEKTIYDYHENDPFDPGYRAFLDRLAKPLCSRIPNNAHGLDFGCGPGPTLSLMLEERGHEMALYDLYYQPDQSVLQQQYQFITCTEVIEHLRNPSETFELLFSMLSSGGVLGLMTKLIPSLEKISTWHYTRDLTHICFYQPKTFDYLADRFNAKVEILAKDVMIMTRLD